MEDLQLSIKGTLKVPDFKLHGENYFLEVGVETGPKGFRPNWNKYAKEVDDIYSNCCLKDAKVLAINIADGKVRVFAKSETFYTNGIKVLSVRTITSKKTSIRTTYTALLLITSS